MPFVAVPDASRVGELAETRDALRECKYPLSVEAVQTYLHLVLRWNAAYNLTAARDYRELLDRHFVDSLAIAPWLRGTRILDIGSGAGFPGIPMALCFPDKRFELLDGNGKKCRFLFQARTELGLDNVMIRHTRVEAYQPEQPPDCILSRAFGSLATVCALARPITRPGSRLLCMKGRNFEQELDEIPADYQLDLVQALPGAAQTGAHLVLIRKGQESPEQT